MRLCRDLPHSAWSRACAHLYPSAVLLFCGSDGEGGWGWGAQGRQLLVYGGERSTGEGGDAQEDDEDDDCAPISDVCTLDALAHFWVTLPMDGADPPAVVT